MSANIRYFMAIGLILTFLSGSGPAFGEERVFVVPFHGTDTGQMVLLHRSDLAGRRFDFQKAVSKAKRKVTAAARNIKMAEEEDARNYFRMEYIRQRALHCDVIATYIILVKRDHEQFLRKIAQKERDFLTFSRCSQTAGMRNIMLLVLEMRDGGRSVRHRAGGLNGETSVAAFSDIAEDLHLWTLANLITPPVMADPEYKMRVAGLRRRLQGGLKILDTELAYLADRLDSIPLAEKL